MLSMNGSILGNAYACDAILFRVGCRLLLLQYYHTLGNGWVCYLLGFSSLLSILYTRCVAMALIVSLETPHWSATSCWVLP